MAQWWWTWIRSKPDYCLT